MVKTTDFEDDGGTPAWRARYAPAPRRRYRPWRWVLAFLTLAMLLPWVILIGGLGGIAMLDFLAAAFR